MRVISACSVCLTAAEAETIPTGKEKILAAGSRNTVRSRRRTGKPTRQLQSSWTDAWHADGATGPLPMPLILQPDIAKIDKLAEMGHADAKQLVTCYVD